MAEGYADLAPQYVLQVQGQDLKSDVTQFVERVEYESSDSMIDTAKITLVNPDFVLSSSKVFMPGNELDIYMGYLNPLYVGRVILMRPRVIFPFDGMPTLEVAGYSKDYLMREKRPFTGNTIPQKKGGSKPGRVVYKDTTVREILEDKAADHLLSEDIDDAPWPKGGIVHEARASDFDVIRAIANLTGYIFWVDYDPETKWTLHFKRPDQLAAYQLAEHTFRYNFGDKTTLLSFEPEFLFQGHYTQIRVQSAIRHPILGITGFEDIILAEKGELEPDPAYAGAIEEIEGPFPNAELIKIYIGDYSFAILPKVEIASRSALEVYAEQWFRRMREDFIVGNGYVTGVETLMARQVHTLEGLGDPYDGKYYFSNVRHIMSSGEGYRCEFTARKQLEE
jgi:phage protein D